MILSIMAIPLTQGLFALVDAEDFERLNRHKWFAMKSSKTHYAARADRVKCPIKLSYMHREIMHIPENMQVDHINYSGLDNRRCNLRICSREDNLRAQRPQKGSSRFRGVSWDREHDNWRVQSYSNGKHINLGHYENEEEAARAYDSAAKELFGEFAYLNFPEEGGV